MADQNLIKTKIEGGDRKFSEFENGDTAPVSQGGTGANNAADARVNLGVPAVGDIISDHGALSGLGDDDHPQYLNETRGDARYYTESEVDVFLGNKADLVGGVIPSSQLPSFVDDVLEFANLAAFPNPGETGKVYVALDTNTQYRWSGSQYIEFPSGVLPFFAFATLSSAVGTDASAPQSALELSTIVPEIGTYELRWSGTWSHNAQNTDALLQIRQNSTVILRRYVVEPQDSGGNAPAVIDLQGGTISPGTNQRLPFSGHLIFPSLPAGPQLFEIFIGTSDTDDSTCLFDATLSLERKGEAS